MSSEREYEQYQILTAQGNDTFDRSVVPVGITSIIFLSLTFGVLRLLGFHFNHIEHLVITFIIVGFIYFAYIVGRNQEGDHHE